MVDTPQTSSRLSWLTASLGERRSRLTSILRRMVGLGEPGAMKSSIFGKFLNLIEQVAGERDKEMELMSQIDAIEQKHRFMRDHHKLERADPDFESKPKKEFDHEDDCEEDNEKSKEMGFGLKWFFAKVLGDSMVGSYYKKQELNLD